jgi:tetratricopeptide (TPR) repeat protein
VPPLPPSCCWACFTTPSSRAERDAADRLRQEAEDQRQEAEDQRLRAEEQEAKAHQEKKDADEQRRQAEANFQLARKAVDDFSRKLEQSPGWRLEELNRELLEMAAVFYQEFVRQRGGDPAVRAASARTFLRLAQLTGELGFREKEAIALYEQALAIFEQLHRDEPNDVATQEGLARTLASLGRAYRDISQLLKAHEVLKQALALQEGLAAKDPANAVYQGQLARTYYDLGLLYHSQGRSRAQVEPVLRKALSVLEKLAGKQPLSPSDRQTQGEIYYALGNVYHNSGALDEALTAYAQSLAVREKLAGEHPDVDAYDRDVAHSLAGLGAITFGLGRPKEARDYHKKALEIRERLVKLHPTITRYAADLGSSYRALGNQTQGKQKRQEKVEWFSKAIAVLEALLKREPRDFEARENLSVSYALRARAYIQLGRYSDALADWEHAEEWNRGPNRSFRLGKGETLARLDRYQQAIATVAPIPQKKLAPAQQIELARVFTLSAQAVRRDTQLPAGQRDKLVEEYAGRAVALLAQAEGTGHALDRIKTDPDFDSLRGRKDFQKLLGGAR